MIFTYYPNSFWHKRKIQNFDPYIVMLAIATNILLRYMIGSVVQGHILCSRLYKITVIKKNLHWRHYIFACLAFLGHWWVYFANRGK